MAKGYLALVLHGHLPFVRHPEHQDSFEESWLYQAITEVYVPLLLMLDALVDDAVDFRLTFSLTPTLVSMLTDPFLQSRYVRRLERLIRLLEVEVARTNWQPEFQTLALMYCEQFTQIRSAFLERYGSDLVGAFRRLQNTGKLEIIASTATHGYLPLLAINPSAVRAQIQVGVGHYAATFGRQPKGFWLPECGYYPGVDELLTEHGIAFTILETHGITRARPRPRYGVHAPVLSPAGLAVFGRDPDSSRQVWSAQEGYPGDSDYREYYRDLAQDLDSDSLDRYVHAGGLRVDTGIKYYRITGRTENKQVYIPEKAREKAEIHGEHFCRSRKEQIESLASVMDRKPVVVAPYDAELFGHWWYEGPHWLNHVIRETASDSESVQLITLSDYLAECPAFQPSRPPMCSWGRNGYNEVWLNPDTQWIYSELQKAARVMEKLESKCLRADALIVRAVEQARRELLLAQSSDWAFMISARTTSEYANTRTKSHLANFNRLSDQVFRGIIDEAWLAEIESRDCIFPAQILRNGNRASTKGREQLLECSHAPSTPPQRNSRSPHPE
jgi:1,4-alpha-glucan branching enzyme